MPPQTTFLDRPFLLPSAVLALGFMLAAGIGSYTFYLVRSLDNTISVTGSATEEVKADHAKWRIDITRNAVQSGTPAAYAAVGSDMAALKQYLSSQGIAEGDLLAGAVLSDQDYSYNSDPNAPKRYNVHQTLTVDSDDVDKIQALSQNISSLVTRGIFVSPQAPEYYVTKLADIRIQLLGKAIADAKARAGQLVKDSGSSVGKLKSAASGVVQVLAPNSTNVEDYGTYDTSTIDKQVMVTARATFLVK